MIERGQRAPKVVDVAALAGVAPSTVSKALNGTGSLKAATIARVRAAADQLSFTPDAGARGLSMRRTFTVGLLSTDDVGRIGLPILLGAEDTLVGGDVSVLFATARRDPVRERHHLTTFQSRRVDGIILVGGRSEGRRPIAADVPVVYALSPSSDERDTSVMTDEAAAMRRIAEHLVGRGRQRVAYVGGPEQSRASTARATALAATLAELGGELVVPPLHGEWSERWGRDAVGDLLVRRRAQVDAIVCGADQIARGVTDELRLRGVAVPGDVAVTGFDDWDDMALSSRPPLTTVDARLKHVGQTAAELLLDLIAGESRPGIHLVEPRLIQRGSTAD